MKNSRTIFVISEDGVYWMANEWTARTHGIYAAREMAEQRLKDIVSNPDIIEDPEFGEFLYDSDGKLKGFLDNSLSWDYHEITIYEEYLFE